MSESLPTAEELQILDMRALRGPNQWTDAPVLECWVDLGNWNEISSDILHGFNERLLKWLPGLIEHRCNIGERGGFVRRLQRGTYPAHILEHITIELHGMAGVDIWYGRARHTSKERIYRVVFKYKDETLARECFQAARELFLAAALDLPFDVRGSVDKLRDVAGRSMLSPEVRALVDAAARRNIPHIRVRDGLVQFGHGARQRRMLGTQSDRLGSIAAAAAGDPELLARQLLAAGVPLEVARPDAPEAAGLEYRLLMVGRRLTAALEDGARDVTDEVHPTFAAAAAEVMAALDWDIASMDIRTGDIRSPLQNQQAAIVNVLPQAELRAHLVPAEGKPRPVDNAVVDLLFPPGEDGRIPVIAITGANGKTTVARLVAHILQATGKCVGMTCTDGVYLDGRRIARGDCSGPRSARQILLNPRAEVAVFETARGGILRAGLAFDECGVAVVTNVGRGDHLGIGEIAGAEELATLKSTIVRVVSPQGTAVLNAADPLVAGIAGKCRGRVLFFAADPENPVVERHRSGGGQVVFVRDGIAVFAEGPQERPVLRVDRIPLTMGGRVAFQVENLLASIGAACALGVPPELIARQAESFTPDLDHNPMRYNVFDIGGATAVVDFGHNPDALEAAIASLDQFGQLNRTAVFSSSGDRRDEDILRMGELLGAAFDRVILYEDDDLYYRSPGEVIALLRRGMAGGGRVSRVEEVQGGLNALEHALDTLEAGQLLFAQAHMADPTANFLRQRLTV